MSHEVILINIAGPDKPGLTSTLTSVLAEYGAAILDMGQAVIHETLALGLLVEVPGDRESYRMLKDLLFRAHELGLHIRFTPISDEEYGHWVESQGKGRHVVTLLGRAIMAEQVSRLSGIIARHGLNIDLITRLSRRAKLSEDGQYACLEFQVGGNPPNTSDFRNELMGLALDSDIDVAFQEDTMFRRHRRLVAFDMDSTLIQCEVIDELAKEAGVGDEVSSITAAAMRGEIEFKESFAKRLALLEGLPEAALAKVAERMPLTAGVERLMKGLKKIGLKTAIISGGFNYFAERLQQQLGFDYAFSNELEIVGGRVTGKVSGAIVDGARKADLLRTLAMAENISLEQVIAVGDGANDLPMLNLAGLGIAYHAKPLVRESAKHSISSIGLDGLLYLIGVRDRELTEL